MPLYEFYLYRPDGGAVCFEAVELASDSAARACAERLLREHASSAQVVVYQAERRVCARERSDVVDAREGAR